MQNQKTTKQSLPDDLPELSYQEEALVEAVSEGLDNSAAYKKAYGASGYSSAALKVRACRKIAEPHIQEHLRALRSVGFANTKLTLEQRLETEMAFAQRAEDAGNFGAAGGAHDRINKLMGLYVDRIMDMTDHDPRATLEQLAQLSPELAKKLADAHGIVWNTETAH